MYNGGHGKKDYVRFPDYSNVLETHQDSTGFTAQHDGWLIGFVSGSWAITKVYINGSLIAESQLANTTSYYATSTFCLPIKKGDVVTFNATITEGNYAYPSFKILGFKN